MEVEEEEAVDGAPAAEVEEEAEDEAPAAFVFLLVLPHSREGDTKGALRGAMFCFKKHRNGREEFLAKTSVTGGNEGLGVVGYMYFRNYSYSGV